MCNYTVNIKVDDKIENQKELSGDLTIQFLRNRFYAMSGYTQDSLKIIVNGIQITDETKTLAELSKSSSKDKSKIIDIELKGIPEFGDLTDVSKIKKFEISDEDYGKRKNTFREWKRQHGAQISKNKKSKSDFDISIFEIEKRCEVISADNGSPLTGTIKFVGEIEGTNGNWVGVALDRPLGTNNGSFNNDETKRYFECEEKFGIYVRPENVKIENVTKVESDEDEM